MSEKCFNTGCFHVTIDDKSQVKILDLCNEQRFKIYLGDLDAIYAAIHEGDEAETECCGNCRYFIDSLCQRYPPVTVYSPSYGDNPLPWNPAVDEDEWCGEHRRKE